jgi:excisionase family DNA binding protein
MSPFEKTRWLTVAECAEALGLSEKAVRHRIKRGQIPASTGLGTRSLRVDFKAVVERLEQGLISSARIGGESHTTFSLREGHRGQPS